MSTYLTLHDDKPEGTTHYLYNPAYVVFYKIEDGKLFRWIGFKWVDDPEMKEEVLLRIDQQPNFSKKQVYAGESKTGIYTNAKYKGD